MLLRYRESSLFIYALGVSVIAFVSNSVEALLIPSLINGALGLVLGSKRLPMKLLLTLLALSIWGAFLNGLYFHNTGEVIISTQVLTVKSGAIESFLVVNFRFFLVVGATLTMLGLVNIRDLIKSLERDLRMPPGLAFSIAYAFRLFPLLSRDLNEVLVARRERGVGTNIINPNNLRSTLLPILNLSYERAVWGGISAELRGLSFRKSLKRKPLGPGDLIIILALTAQWLISYLIPLLV
ncbi:MAG: energy-coupling factor transporter transmembrane component T [Zestosphaera sp.]